MKHLALLIALFLPLQAQENEFDKRVAEDIKRIEKTLANSNLPEEHAKTYREMIARLKNGEAYPTQYSPKDSWNLVDVQFLPESGSKSGSKTEINHWDKKLTEVFQNSISASADGIKSRSRKTSKKEDKPDEVATSGYNVSITPPPNSMKPGNTYTLSARITSFSNGNTSAAFGPPQFRSYPSVNFFGAPGSNVDPKRNLKILDHVDENGKRVRRNRYGITKQISKVPGKIVIEKSVRFFFPKRNNQQYIRIGVGIGSTSPTRVVYVYKYNGKPLPRLALQALDANPSYYEDTLPANLKTLQMINSKVIRLGTTADATSQLIIRAELTSSSPATFSLDSKDNGTITPLLGGKTIFHQQKHYAFALYTPPAVFTPDQKPPASTFDLQSAPKQRLDKILEYRDIKVHIVIAGSPKKHPLTLQLARPPVVLVHGLGSNAYECWATTKSNGTSMIALLEKAGFLPFTVNYQKTNGVPGAEAGSSFAANHRAVWDRADPFEMVTPDRGWLGENEHLPIISEYQRVNPNRIGGIKHALKQYREKYNLAATRADVIGHSMGGILARCYSSETYNPTYRRPANFNQGDINRIITLNTPHHGSELAHVYTALTKAWIGKEEWIKWGKRMLPSLASHYVGVQTPAIRDLTAPLTPDDLKASALAKIQPNTKVPAFAIATTVDHNQLGSADFDHMLKYRLLYGTIGMVFFHNRPLLNDFIDTRFDQWKNAATDIRQGAITPSGTTISPDDPNKVRDYKLTIQTSIDDNAIYWAKRRKANHREELINNLKKTTIVPFGAIDNDRSEDVTPGMFGEYEQTVGNVSDVFIGGDLTKLKNIDSDQDVPSSSIGLIRSLIFHNDPKNDGAVRVVSQLGGLPESSTATFGDQDGGIIHSYSPWHYRLQREVIHLLKWQNARFDPTGFPAAGQLTSRHLPSTDLTKDTTTGDDAIKWAGIVPSHAHAYAKVADDHEAVILVRPVNRDSTALIAKDNATKAMAVKGKSSNWGPQKGFIPVEQRFSKLWQVHKKNPSVRAEKVIEYDAITQEVLLEQHPVNKGRKYVKEAALIKDGYEVLAIPAPMPPDPEKPAPAATEADAEKAIVMKKGDVYHDWQRIERKLTADQVKSLKPLNVLAVDQVGDVKYVTADYDLLAIGRYDEAIVKQPESYKHGPPEAVTSAPFHKLMGFVSEPQITIINDLNKYVENTGYDGGYVTHHGPEVQYYKSPYVDYPILVCDPGEPKIKNDQSVFIIHQGPPGFRDIHLKRYFTQQIRKGYRLWPNPDSKGWLWEDYRKFDMETGYDPTDSPRLLSYVAEQTDPHLDKADPESLKPEVAAKYHLVKALTGDTESQIELAHHYLDGLGIPKNPAKYREWIKRAADSGSPDALAAYGEDLLIGHGGPPNHQQAITHIRMAIQINENPHALYLMAYAFREGLGLPKDATKAQNFLIQASNKGLIEAQLDLADITFESDKSTARKLYQKAAEQDSARGHLALGNYHYQGWLEAADVTKAVTHFEKAVALGDNSAAHTYLGFIYLDGQGVIPKNPQKAVTHFQSAAQAGQTAAQVELARCLGEGKGIKKNPVAAHVWYKMALLSGESKILDELNTHQRTLTPTQRKQADARYNQINKK